MSSTYPTNILEQVQTYQLSSLAFLQNLNCILPNTNKEFNNFQNFQGNLGSSVTFDRPPRFRTVNSLVAQWEGAEQLQETLTVNQQKSTSFTFTAQQLIFNVEDYMKKFGKSAIAEIGTEIEMNLAQNFITSPYRFYGSPTTPINTYAQLADALMYFRNFGSANGEAKMFITDVSEPGIINTGLNQFAPARANKDAMSWEVGSFSNCDVMRSNLLQVHNAGSEGNAGVTLTVVSTTKDINGAITAITFSGTSAPSDPDSVKRYDSFQFKDNVSGQPNIRFRTYIGYNVSSCPVQFKATSDAASTGGSQVTVTIDPPLQAAFGKNQNISVDVQPGMQVTVLPDHRAGLIMAGNPFFMAMPALPEEIPYPSSSAVDPETGASMRLQLGSVFGQNQSGMIYSTIWGAKLISDYCLKLVFPV